MVQIIDYSALEPAWCPGCGNFGILKALNQALVSLGLEPHQILLVSGIGQASKLPHYTKGNVFNSLHGRALPPAIGAKIANTELTVIVCGGDGDGYGEGANHFINAIRRNHDITYLVHNNQVYGLTKGQASPTSDYGFVTKTTPHGADIPLNPMALALAAEGTFIARGFAGDTDHLTDLIARGIEHPGFALVDILQPCVSFNHRNTYSWYRERIYKLSDVNHDSTDKAAAFEKSQEWEERIPIGVVYKANRPIYEERITALKKGPLVKRTIDPTIAESFLETFM